VHRASLEILGSLAVLAASLLLGLVLIYLVAMVHRSEERDAMTDFTAMFGEGDNVSKTKVSHPFLEGASDVIIAGDRLVPGEACVQFLFDKIHELHPEFDLAPAHAIGIGVLGFPVVRWYGFSLAPWVSPPAPPTRTGRTDRRAAAREFCRNSGSCDQAGPNDRNGSMHCRS
jgi:hypothetical protein